MKKTLLLLEDDIALNETIVDYLESKGYEVISVYDGNDALNIIYEKNFDLLLLDVNVPNINGFEILEKIRKDNVHTPSIFLTSLNSMSDLENGYNSGCDDYIRKPFALKELSLRIETILKRNFSHINEDIININDDILYNITNDNLIIDNQMIQLNKKDSILLKFFLQNKNRLISHEEIYSILWEYDEEISPSALRTYIKNLRKYLGKETIVNIKKSGYRFNI